MVRLVAGKLVCVPLLTGLHALAFPVHIVAHRAIGAVAVEHAGQHKHQVGQAVEVLARRVFQCLLRFQRHHGAFGAARHGAAHMGLGGGACARGQDELLQAWQVFVVLGQRLVQRQHGLGLEQLKAWNGQLATQVEELVLDFYQQHAHALGHGLAQQQADVAVELVHVTHGVHTQAVLADARVVAEAGGAVVPGAGGDLGEAVSHGAVLG